VTQLALQLQQERTQVVCSNREARKRPTKLNSTPAMDLGHTNVVLKWRMCMLVVDLGIGMILNVNIIISMIIMFCFFLLVFFPDFFF